MNRRRSSCKSERTTAGCARYFFQAGERALTLLGGEHPARVPDQVIAGIRATISGLFRRRNSGLRAPNAAHPPRIRTEWPARTVVVCPLSADFFLDFLAGGRSLSHRPDERGPSNGVPHRLRTRLRYERSPPLDVSARDAFLRVGERTGELPRLNLATKKPDARAAFGWNRRRMLRRGTVPTRFVAEAESFGRAHSVKGRASRQERETS
jgi:hypothetical protein